jgi:hypothetical protein
MQAKLLVPQSYVAAWDACMRLKIAPNSTRVYKYS